LLVSEPAQERKALVDVIAGRTIAREGRVWVDRIPSMRETIGRLAQLVGEVESPALLAQHRSILWNVLAFGSGGILVPGSVQQLPGQSHREAGLRALRLVDLEARQDEIASTVDAETAARVGLARVLVRSPRYVLIREPQETLRGKSLARFLAQVALLARLEHLTVLVSLSPSEAAIQSAGRVLALAEGLLVFDGSPAAFAGFERAPGPSRAARSLSRSMRVAELLHR